MSQRPYPFEALRPKIDYNELVWTLLLNIANSLNSMGFESENRGTHGTTIGTSSPIIPFERFSAYVMILQKTILQKWRDPDYENEIAKYPRPKGSIEQLFDWSLEIYGVLVELLNRHSFWMTKTQVERFD